MGFIIYRESATLSFGHSFDQNLTDGICLANRNSYPFLYNCKEFGMTSISRYVISLLAFLNARNQPESEARTEDRRRPKINAGGVNLPLNSGDVTTSIGPSTLVGFGVPTAVNTTQQDDLIIEEA
jgi:hypothetical protein